MVYEIEKPISDLLQNHRFRESSDGGDCCTVNQTVAILETVLKRLLPRFTAIVTSFENMIVRLPNDRFRCTVDIRIMGGHYARRGFCFLLPGLA